MANSGVRLVARNGLLFGLQPSGLDGATLKQTGLATASDLAEATWVRRPTPRFGRDDQTEYFATFQSGMTSAPPGSSLTIA